MYTRCPSCSSTFRVTATILQMAGGDVRCGACGSVFNALQTLVDDWTDTDYTRTGAPVPDRPDAPAAGPQSPEAQPAPAPPDGPPPATPEDALEFDVPETEWQRFFITPQPPAAAPRAEPALGTGFDEIDGPGEAAPTLDAPPLDAEDSAAGTDAAAPHRTLEQETADTDTWQGFLREAEAGEPDAGEDEPEYAEPPFVVEDGGADGESTILVRRPPPAAAEPPALGPAVDEPAPAGAPERTAETFAVTGLDDEDGDEDEDERNAPAAELASAVAAPTADADAPAPEQADDDADGRAATPAPPGPGSPGAVADPALAARRTAAADTVLDWGPAPAFPGSAPRRPAHTARWLAASLLAALALGAQLVHYSRDALAADPAWGSATRSLYARLGVPLNPGWPLDAYEIRGAKAIAENTTPGALDIVAEIAVTGDAPVGAPLVRIVLRDRWSNVVASGVFEPSVYLAEAPPATGVYAPGSLIPVSISLADPGSAAQGYELDVCLPNRQLGLQCRATRDPFRR